MGAIARDRAFLQCCTIRKFWKLCKWNMISISAQRVGFNILRLNHKHSIQVVATENTRIFCTKLSVHLLIGILAFAKVIQRFSCVAWVVHQLPVLNTTNKCLRVCFIRCIQILVMRCRIVVRTCSLQRQAFEPWCCIL